MSVTVVHIPSMLNNGARITRKRETSSGADMLAHPWPYALLYVLLPISLNTLVLIRMREKWLSVTGACTDLKST